MSTRLRRALREFTDFPATTTIGILWIAVYAAMAWYQGTPQASRNWLAGGIRSETTHAFGDLTSLELYRGQVWRVITATFVHYSLLHLGLNLLSLYQLGRVVEDWYGSWRFVMLYAILGGLGNALAGLVRPYVPGLLPGNPWLTHSGGGSTAVFGLVTLIAVGAWRAKTRFGDYAMIVAVLLLLLNVGLAAVLWWYGVNIDHYGHAGGALVGAVVGLANHALSRDPEGRAARRAGLVGVIVLIASAGAQAWADRAEVRVVHQIVALRTQVARRFLTGAELNRLDQLYRERHHRGPRPTPIEIRRSPKGPTTFAIVTLPLSLLREELRASRKRLEADAIRKDLDAGPTSAPYRRLLTLAGRAVERAPTPGEFHAFEESWALVFRRAEAEAHAALAALKALQPRAVPTGPK